MGLKKPDQEKVADLCHEQWAGWMKYLFSKCVRVDGKAYLAMPVEFEERWKRQMNTPYANLSEPEQDSDREEANKFIALLEEEKEGADPKCSKSYGP